MKNYDLPGEAQRLLEIMRRIGFGRLENIHLKNGHPIATPESRAVRSMMFDKKTFEHTGKRADGDYILNDRQLTFIQAIQNVANGSIVSVSVSEGLPVRMEITENISL